MMSASQFEHFTVRALDYLIACLQFGEAVLAELP